MVVEVEVGVGAGFGDVDELGGVTLAEPLPQLEMTAARTRSTESARNRFMESTIRSGFRFSHQEMVSLRHGINAGLVLSMLGQPFYN